MTKAALPSTSPPTLRFQQVSAALDRTSPPGSRGWKSAGRKRYQQPPRGISLLGKPGVVTWTAGQGADSVRRQWKLSPPPPPSTRMAVHSRGFGRKPAGVTVTKNFPFGKPRAMLQAPVLHSHLNCSALDISLVDSGKPLCSAAKPDLSTRPPCALEDSSFHFRSGI